MNFLLLLGSSEADIRDPEKRRIHFECFTVTGSPFARGRSSMQKTYFGMLKAIDSLGV